METTTYTARILRPSDGHAITQKNPDTPILERLIARKEVWLAAQADPDDYIEITEAEAKAYDEAKEAAMKAAEETAKAE